jgi:hypothetical protein
MVSARSITLTLGLALTASSAVAQTPAAESLALTASQVAVACAPAPILGVIPADAPRVMGNQDVVTRSLFGQPEEIVINAGTDRGIQFNQRFFVRRIFRGAETYRDKLPHLVVTAGWVRVVAANKTMALVSPEHSCGDMLEGDFLEPFQAPVLPNEDITVAVTEGELDFASYGRILYGASERRSGSAGEFMLIDRGADKNVAVGSHFAIYRDREVAGLPLTPIGEATAVAVGPAMSLVRITKTRDAVFTHDVVVPRGQAPSAAGAEPPKASSDVFALVASAIRELSEYGSLMADGATTEASERLKAARQTVEQLQKRRP